MYVGEALLAVQHVADTEGREATSLDVGAYWHRGTSEAAQALLRAWQAGYLKRRRCWAGAASFQYVLTSMGGAYLDEWEAYDLDDDE